MLITKLDSFVKQITERSTELCKPDSIKMFQSFMYCLSINEDNDNDHDEDGDDGNCTLKIGQVLN